MAATDTDRLGVSAHPDPSVDDVEFGRLPSTAALGLEALSTFIDGLPWSFGS